MKSLYLGTGGAGFIGSHLAEELAETSERARALKRKLAIITYAQDFSLCLPSGGEATFRDQMLKGTGPRELAVVKGKAQKSSGTDLIKKAG